MKVEKRERSQRPSLPLSTLSILNLAQSPHKRNISSLSKYFVKPVLQKIDLSLLLREKEYENNVQYRQLLKILQSYNNSLDSLEVDNLIVTHEVHRQLFLQLSKLSTIEKHLKIKFINQIYSWMQTIKNKGMKLDQRLQNYDYFTITKDQEVKRQTKSLIKSTHKTELIESTKDNWSKREFKKSENIHSFKKALGSNRKYILNKQNSASLKSIQIDFEKSQYSKSKNRLQENLCKHYDIFQMIKSRYQSMIATPLLDDADLIDKAEEVKKQSKQNCSKTYRLKIHHRSHFFPSYQRQRVEIKDVTGLSLINQSCVFDSKTKKII